MQKDLSSREGCLGICTLMFRGIAEGFTECELWFLPSKATSNSKSKSLAAITWSSQTSGFTDHLMNFNRFRPIPEDTGDYMVSICLSCSLTSSFPSLTLGAALSMDLWGTWLAPSTAYLKLVHWKCIARKMCGWSMNRGDKEKDRPLLSSREWCLGVCNLMFCGVPEGFMNIGLQLLPSKAPSESKFQFRAATWLF